MLVCRRVTPSSKFAGTPLYTFVERGTSVNYLLNVLVSKLIRIYTEEAGKKVKSAYEPSGPSCQSRGYPGFHSIKQDKAV